MKNLNSLSNSWQTPKWLFKELDAEFNFSIDLCATAENSKCGTAYCEDYLNDHMSIEGGTDCTLRYLIDVGDIKTAFINPPYSNPKPFIEKAWEDSKCCKIVCLVKCDPSTKWWSTFWNYKSTYQMCLHCLGEEMRIKCFLCDGTGGKVEKIGPKPGCEVRFFPKRIQFDPPQELIDSGEVWKEIGARGHEKFPSKWVQKCEDCGGDGYILGFLDSSLTAEESQLPCLNCNSKGYRPLSGPTFSCALLIFDRRGL